MNHIGKRLYYDKKTGLIIQETAEQIAYFETTGGSIEQDVLNLTNLSERNRDTFDVIELEYGQYMQDFAECNGYRINPATKEIEFSYPDPNQPEQPPVYQKPLSEQIKSLELQQLQTNEDLSSLMDFIITGGM